MTDALERTLRDGPPDEAGYRARQLDPSTGMPGAMSTGTTAGTPVRIVPSVRAGSAGRIDLVPAGRSWRQVAAVMVVLIGLVAVGFASMSNRSGVGTQPSPAVSLPAFTETFESTRNGFSVRYPAGWIVTPATASWPPNTLVPLGNPALDRLELPGSARLTVASQPLGAGLTEADWLAAYFPPYPKQAACIGDPSTWPRLRVDGASAYLDVVGCPTDAGKEVAVRDVSFQAIAFAGGRIYQLSLNGDVDRAYFEALLASVRLEPSRAVD